MVQCAGDEEGTKLMTEAIKVLENHIDCPFISEKKTLVHIKYAEMLSDYGYSLLGQNKLREAKEVLEEALELQEKYLHKNSIMIIWTLHHLGTVYHRCDQYEEAQKIRNIFEDRMNSLNRNDRAQFSKLRRMY